MVQNLPDVETKYHEQFRTFNVDGIFGGMRGMHLEAILYSDEMETEQALSTAQAQPQKTKVKRTIQSRLIIDPLEAKIIIQWLTAQINQYEKLFGRVPSPEELESKASKSGLE